jgi:hypothetical protein
LPICVFDRKLAPLMLLVMSTIVQSRACIELHRLSYLAIPAVVHLIPTGLNLNTPILNIVQTTSAPIKNTKIQETLSKSNGGPGNQGGRNISAFFYSKVCSASFFVTLCRCTTIPVTIDLQQSAQSFAQSPEKPNPRKI